MACGIGRQPYGCLLHFIVAARGPAPPPRWNIHPAARTDSPSSLPARRSRCTSPAPP